MTRPTITRASTLVGIATAAIAPWLRLIRMINHVLEGRL